MSRTSTVLCILAMAALVAAMVGYYFWTAKKTPAISETPTDKHRLITGITYTEEKPSAIVDGEILYEGDTINGVKVVKIHRNRVEFEKGGKRWTQQLRKEPTEAQAKKGD